MAPVKVICGCASLAQTSVVPDIVAVGSGLITTVAISFKVTEQLVELASSTSIKL